MTVWFSVNALLTVLVCLFVAINRDCPHRLRFYSCFIVLVMWLVPWQVFSGFMGSYMPVQGLDILGSAFPGETGPISSGANGLTDWLSANSGTLIISACAAGILLFISNLWRHFQFMRELQANYEDGSYLWVESKTKWDKPRPVDIRIQDKAPGALNSGIFTPVIWVNRELISNSGLQAVLLHEAVHIGNRDNLYLSIITFVENLFWWNPLVLFLGKLTREIQELACDEKCAGIAPNYRAMLNNLFLLLSPNNETNNFTPLNTAVLWGENFNVKRIKILQRRNTMKAKHYLTSVIFVMISVITIGMVSAQEDADDPAQIVSEVMEKRKADPDYVPTTREVLAGMEVYTAKLEQAYSNLKNENEELRTELAELKSEIERSR